MKKKKMLEFWKKKMLEFWNCLPCIYFKVANGTFNDVVIQGERKRRCILMGFKNRRPSTGPQRRSRPNKTT